MLVFAMFAMFVATQPILLDVKRTDAGITRKQGLEKKIEAGKKI